MLDKTPIFAVEPESLFFEPHEEKALTKHLSSVNRCTVHSEIMAPSDIQFDQYGRLLRGGLRFTSIAMAQLCQQLSPGLTKLAFSVSGINEGREPSLSYSPLSTRHISTKTKTYSISKAMKLINEVAELRFGNLEGRKLIRNAKTGVVDGITGGAYLFFSNNDFFEQVVEATRSNRQLQFLGASLFGRRLTVFYGYKEAIAEHNTQVLRLGYRFSNSETGDCSVRGNKVLLLDKSPVGSCSRSSKDYRLSHSGTRFNKRFQTVLMRVMTEVDDNLLSLEKHLNHLCQTKLGFSSEEKSFNDRYEDFLRVLDSYKLTSSLSKQILSLTVHCKSSVQLHKSDYFLNSSSWASKSVFDLLLAVLTKSSDVHHSTQEALDRLGYSIVANKFKLP